MRTLHRFAATLASIVLVAASLGPAGSKARAASAPTSRDIAAMASASDVRLSPDGRIIVYALTTRTFDDEAKPSDKDPDAGWKTDRQLFLADVAGADGPRQITFGDEKASSPRWSPDGAAIAFLREHDGDSKIHVLPMTGGEAAPVSTGDLEPESFAWSPDGASFAFLAPSPKTDDENEWDWRTGGAVDHDRQWRSSHLWVVPRAGGEPRQVTTWDRHVAEFDWSPDGRQFAVLSTQSADPYYAFSLRTVEIIDAGTGAVAFQVEQRPRAADGVHWSPDGRRIAWMTGVETLSLLNALMVHEVGRGVTYNAASGLDPTLGGFAWSGDSKSIIAHSTERTRSMLYRIGDSGRAVQELGDPGRIILSELSADRAGSHLAFLASTIDEPADPSIISLDSAPRRARVITRLNPQTSDWTLGQGSVVRWTCPEGAEIEGVLVRTPRTDVGSPAPLMVLPHGGPDGVSTERWSSWAQFFASRGFNVLMPNYRGGLGYGRDFYAANRGRLGEIEFMDIESGVDHLVRTGEADPERLASCGWSWGGYLTAWTIGHTPRYKAAVVGAGVIDTISQYALSDINHGAAAEWEFKGNPWMQWANFDRANPLRSLHNVTTPTLIIHGRNDDRVPFSQGAILYRALADTGCEVKFLAYPREPHGFREPAHSAHMLGEWADWCAERIGISPNGD